MKKYKNIDSGRIAVLVADDRTKTMKYEDDGSEEIITPASFKHEWEFVSDDEPVAPAEPAPIEEPKPENSVESVPTDRPSDEDDDFKFEPPYEELLEQGIRKDIVKSLQRINALDEKVTLSTWLKRKK